MKYFTLKEAEALIPEFEKIYQVVEEIANKAEEKAETIRRIEQGRKPDAAQLVIEKAQLQFLAGGADEWFQKIVELGALPKGLDPSLVDFPARINGKEVYLCWKRGEKKITHYHGLEGGYSGRRPLPKKKK